jgi:hypothetical protein
VLGPSSGRRLPGEAVRGGEPSPVKVLRRLALLEKSPPSRRRSSRSEIWSWISPATRPRGKGSSSL